MKTQKGWSLLSTEVHAWDEKHHIRWLAVDYGQEELQGGHHSRSRGIRQKDQHYFHTCVARKCTGP